MIRVTSISACTDPYIYDEVYLIVRSVKVLLKRKDPILKAASQMPELSPSESLFYDYRDWDKAGEWNEGKFEGEYRSRFEEQIRNDRYAQARLASLAEKSSKGKMIALLCFCKNEDLCHRKIIGEMLRERGCEVVFDRDMKGT